jgi:putative ABC transport system permease protein
MVFVSKQVAQRLTRGEAEKILALLPPSRLVGLTPLRYETVRSNMLPYTAVGLDFEEIKKTSPFWHLTGSYPNKGGQLLIGVDVSEATSLAPGQSMTLTGRNSKNERYEKDFTVSGVVSTGGVEDGFIFISLADMELATKEAGAIDILEASLTADGGPLEEIKNKVENSLDTVEVKMVTRVTRSEKTVIAKLTFLVYIVSAVVLSLSTICVSTTMMTVVLERRGEIGLKKALGAESKSVAGEFLLEGLLLGLIGGFFGALGGLGFAALVSKSVFGRSFTPEFHLVPATMLVMAIVAVIASMIPVKRAVNAEPALALRGE